jgi:N-acetylglucosamine-6-phosphate deacetylase
MATLLDYATIITPNEILERSAIVVSDSSKISYVGPMESAPTVDGLHLDMRNRIIIPGLIDIHVHGGHGITFGVADTLAEDLRGYSEWVVKNGVTGFLTSILAPDAEQLTEIIKQYVALFDEELPGAEALGIHLEGPFLNVEKKGAQNPDWLHDPSTEEAKAYLEAGKGWIRQMTMAPELPGADDVASLFRRAGVVLAVAHSIAGYETGREAFEGNWTHVTHTFNAQVGLHHRNPGLIGAILSSDGITAELIADLVHVHPCAMEVLVKCLGTDRVVLITDAMSGAGLPDGHYALLDQDVTVKDGTATLKDGTIAGSIAVLNQCVRNMVQEVGVPLPEAVKMATLNPARAMGFANLVGSIAIGKEANLAVIDEDINVYLTMVKGRIVYNNL